MTGKGQEAEAGTLCPRERVRPAEGMIEYEKELNKEQLEVVMQEGGPLLVIAGAGSGKTRTLTYRVARLIERGVKPDRILLATFTNKAARSMLGRVASLIDRDTGLLWGGTFHHIAHRILRRHSDKIGYERNFSISDSEDARQLIAGCITEAKVETKLDKFPKADILGGIFSLAANTETDLTEIVVSRYPYFSHRTDDIVRVAALYRSRKKALNIMDFDDLLANCRLLLSEFPEVADVYAERFLQVLVDEYQDTNILQAQIVDLLAASHGNLMAVGDDSQSIYSFRGAHFANIMKFPEKYPGCRIFKLETNYRSTPEILHLANLSIVNNERQFPKSLRAIREEGVRPVLVCAGNAAQQADFVAQRIMELHRGGVPLKEMAVMYRAHYHSMEVQMEMVRRGIPFLIRSGIRFFEQAHVKDVTAYMRIAANPFDELAWMRVLKLYDKVGTVAAGKGWKFVSGFHEPLAEVRSDRFAACAGKAAALSLAAVGAFIDIVAEAAAAGTGPAELIRVIMDKGYLDILHERHADAASREDDLLQLAGFAEEFGTLDAFLNELALMTDIAEEGRTDRETDEDKVVLTTIHQAKGLEWRVVFIVWCAEGMIPLARALKDPDGEEEERRLFYVAATRAKDQLYLSYPLADYTRAMGHLPLSPSRFIRELGPRLAGTKERPYDEWVVDNAY
jgi:DNA helicase-2/ATP-dependent DNA helicase PcrA